MTAKEIAEIAESIVAIVQPIFTTLNAQLEAQLMQARALERIGTALEAFAAAGQEPSDELLTGCQHPDESRVHFGGMQTADEWQCRDCGYEHQDALVLKVD